MTTPLTEDWLRKTGFKSSQEDRQPHKHWTLWIGQSQACRRGLGRSADDLGIEVTKGDDDGSWWYCWLRGDIAGRYSRFIFARDISSVEDLVRLLEALTIGEFDADRVVYGQYWMPESAERLKREQKRLDVWFARNQREEDSDSGD
jgi:hypothetical protein